MHRALFGLSPTSGEVGFILVAKSIDPCTSVIYIIGQYITFENMRVVVKLVVDACTIIFSGRELAFTFSICYRPSVCLSIVCLSSVVCDVGAPYSAG